VKKDKKKQKNPFHGYICISEQHDIARETAKYGNTDEAKYSKNEAKEKKWKTKTWTTMAVSEHKGKAQKSTNM